MGINFILSIKKMLFGQVAHDNIQIVQVVCGYKKVENRCPNPFFSTLDISGFRVYIVYFIFL